MGPSTRSPGAGTAGGRPRSGRSTWPTTKDAGARSSGRRSRSLAQVRLDELVRLGVVGAAELEAVTPGERLDAVQAGALGQDDRLPGRGEVRVEGVLLEVGGRRAVVGDHHVAELQRLQQLVVG